MNSPGRSFLTLTLCLLAAACADDEGGPTPPTGGTDATIDQPAPLDAVDTRSPDVGDSQPVVDAGPSVDCAAIGCRDQAVFNVPGYLARFGDDGRNIDVTACLGSACGTVRAERLGTQTSLVSAPTGASISLDLSSDGWLRVYIHGGAPPDARQEVRLQIATVGGRQLINYMGQATGQEHCPGGAGCGRCQAAIVDIDPADAGQSVDSGDPRGGHCPM
jgi:hypothetical protein